MNLSHFFASFHCSHHQENNLNVRRKLYLKDEGHFFLEDGQVQFPDLLWNQTLPEALALSSINNNMKSN